MRSSIGRRRTAIAIAAACLSLVAAATCAAGAPSAAGPGGGVAAIVDPPPFADGQVVTVQGAVSTFPAADSGKTLQIEECAGSQAAPPLSNRACDAQDSLDTSTTIAADGSFIDQEGNANGSTGYALHQLGPGTAYPTAPIRCDVLHSCVLYVGVNQNDFSADHVVIDIAWTAPPPTLVNLAPAPPQGPLYVVAGSSASLTVAYGSATDSNGVAEVITGSSVVTTPPAHGTVTATSPGTFTYTASDPGVVSGGSDTFVVAGASVGCGESIGACAGVAPLTGPPVTVQVSILPKPMDVVAVIQSQPGPTRLNVTDPTGMSGGDQVIVSVGELDQETATIATVGPNYLELTAPTQFTHLAGEMVADNAPQGSGGQSTQIITTPISGGVLAMSQPSSAASTGSRLVSTTDQPLVTGADPQPCAGVDVAGDHLLTGQPFFSCGAVGPIEVVNPGTGSPWTVTGTLTDFLDAEAAPGTTCDTVATFNPHCIPAGNFQWAPVAAVDHPFASGTPASVTAGPGLPNVPTIAATASAATAFGASIPSVVPGATAFAVAGTSAMAGWVQGTAAFGITPAQTVSGTATATLCSAAAGSSDGWFVCAANVSVAVPGSASGMGGVYTATLTLTLS